MQTKTTMRCQSTPLQMSINLEREWEEKRKINVSDDMKKLESSYIANEYVKWCGCSRKQCGSSKS